MVRISVRTPAQILVHIFHLRWRPSWKVLTVMKNPSQISQQNPQSNSLWTCRGNHSQTCSAEWEVRRTFLGCGICSAGIGPFWGNEIVAHSLQVHLLSPVRCLTCERLHGNPNHEASEFSLAANSISRTESIGSGTCIRSSGITWARRHV